MYAAKGREPYTGNGAGTFVFEKNFFFPSVVFFKADKSFAIVIGKPAGPIGRNGSAIVTALLHAAVGQGGVAGHFVV